MHLITILLIALALSMDALAVSISSGVALRTMHIPHAIRMGLWFGSFQAIMPVIGWFIGKELLTFISRVDHWVAFGLLSLIGIKMIYESRKLPTEDNTTAQFKTHILFVLAVATSIDALAVGMSLSILQISIVKPVIIIGMVTFILSFIGVVVGKRIGGFFERKIEVIGGLILIGIGIKILVEHLRS